MKLGCCQVVAIAFAVLVASQILVLLVRVLSEVVALSATLIRWIGIGLAGAAGIALLVAAISGVGYGIGWLGKRFSGWMQRLRSRRDDSHSYVSDGRLDQRIEAHRFAPHPHCPLPDGLIHLVGHQF